MAYQATPIRLDPETRATLESWVRASKSAQNHQNRTAIFTECGQAFSLKADTCFHETGQPRSGVKDARGG